MANITLKDINGNNIYPEVDVSTISGTITENNEKFVIGGDVYSALSGKADKSELAITKVTGDSTKKNIQLKSGVSQDVLIKQVNANWRETDSSEPSFIIGKPNIPVTMDYNWKTAELGTSYAYNNHIITNTDISNGYFYFSLPLNTYQYASSVRIMGDMYGFRYIRGNGKDVTSNDVSSIELMLGSDTDTPIENDPIIRVIDSSEFSKSDRNKTYNTVESCFHFSHMCSCRSTMEDIQVVANKLLIKINIVPPTESTGLKIGDRFVVCVCFVQFFE